MLTNLNNQLYKSSYPFIHITFILIMEAPKQIAFFNKDSMNNNNDQAAFVHHINELKEYLSKAGNHPVLFASIIGPYQVGKSSTLKRISGNKHYETGTGNNEKTEGIFIDGPYPISQIKTRFNLSDDHFGQSFHSNNINGQNDDLEPYLYFLDIEGFGGFRYGRNTQSNSLIFQKLVVPFIGISSIVFFQDTPRSSDSSVQTFFNVLSLLNAVSPESDKNNNENRDNERKQNESQKLIMVLTQCDEKMVLENGYQFDYSKPTIETLDINQNNLYEGWAKLRFGDIEMPITISPLLFYDKNIREQSHNFNESFKVLVEKMLQSLKEIIDSDYLFTKEHVLEVFETITNELSKDDLSFAIENARRTQFEMQIIERLQSLENHMNNFIKEFIRHNIKENEIQSPKEIEILKTRTKEAAIHEMKKKILSRLYNTPIVKKYMEKLNELIEQEWKEKYDNVIFRNKINYVNQAYEDSIQFYKNILNQQRNSLNDVKFYLRTKGITHQIIEKTISDTMKHFETKFYEMVFHQTSLSIEEKLSSKSKLSTCISSEVTQIYFDSRQMLTEVWYEHEKENKNLLVTRIWVVRCTRYPEGHVDRVRVDKTAYGGLGKLFGEMFGY
ncbi:hypothetical protein TRFO_20259 [Tritrichomonas foetus]|uniref:Uncharacterized protein n=1 Tax=Tritrichomonas foetus TaxID=1144522 RepID=A0A1J4KHE0_9EUKA|nr:hypothetical protein TRFO_20259 [Tritrichomonas foetus]|eukprot:OHT10450.1 hypothetical protein TRFO_20259 [Tritrichomonas foetus]